MSPAEPQWSGRRARIANGVASALYGVIAIMSAELGFNLDAISTAEAAVGALLVGATMTLTRLVVEIVKKETELSSHLGLSAFAALLRHSLLVMAFPILVTVLVLLGPPLGLPRSTVSVAVPYLGVATVFAIGFGSSYVLDGNPRHALRRGLAWTAMSLLLFAAKQLG